MPGYDRNYCGTPRKGNHNNRSNKDNRDSRDYRDGSYYGDNKSSAQNRLVKLCPQQKSLLLIPEDDEGPFVISPLQKRTLEIMEENERRKEGRDWKKECKKGYRRK